MFCGKCGAKNLDNAKFCTECGAKLVTVKISESDETVRVQSVNDSRRNKRVGMIVVAAVVVIIIVIAVALFGGRSYTATVDQFVDAQWEANAEKILDLIPDEMIEYILEDEGYDDDEVDELIDEANEEIQDQLDDIERYLGEDWEATYTITEVEDLSGDDLDDLKDDYEDFDVKISDAKTIEIELTVTAGETETSNSVDISVIKVGRSWYLDVVSMGNIF